MRTFERIRSETCVYVFEPPRTPVLGGSSFITENFHTKVRWVANLLLYLHTKTEQMSMATFQTILIVLCVLWISLGLFLIIINDDLDYPCKNCQKDDLLDSDVNNKHT